MSSRERTVERLMTYALGRELDARDQPAVRQIMRSTEAKRSIASPTSSPLSSRVCLFR